MWLVIAKTEAYRSDGTICGSYDYRIHYEEFVGYSSAIEFYQEKKDKQNVVWIEMYECKKILGQGHRI